MEEDKVVKPIFRIFVTCINTNNMTKFKLYFRLVLIAVFGITLLLSFFMFPNLITEGDLETKILGYAYMFLFMWSFTIIYYQCKAIAK